MDQLATLPVSEAQPTENEMKILKRVFGYAPTGNKSRFLKPSISIISFIAIANPLTAALIMKFTPLDNRFKVMVLQIVIFVLCIAIAEVWVK